MNTENKYSINTGVSFNALELIDVRKLSEQVKKDWFNQTLCQVNDCVVRLGVVKGQFHWHKHDEEDEFFYVISGKLSIDLKDRTVELTPQQGLVVPKGVSHKTRASERTVILMVEKSTVVPTGD
ncbi:MAG: cupin domain-containing protein [Candidatus Aminicenantes bacterium]|nr:MAG: cupin domain-containing protein [Candidatus Aminicenantes bacterium]